MKKYISILIIILLFLAFYIFDLSGKSSFKVLKIIDASKIQVDLNRNGIVDINETICIPNIKVLSSNLSNNQNDLNKTLKISNEDGIKLGYLSDNFADNELADKNVKLLFTGKKDNDCVFADIKIDNNSYRQKLLISGFGIDSRNLNDKFYKNLETARNIELVILNHKSNKYHKLNCEYGLAAHDAIIVPLKQLSSSSIPCKFCHVQKTKENNKKVSNIPANYLKRELKNVFDGFNNKIKT